MSVSGELQLLMAFQGTPVAGPIIVERLCTGA